MLFYERYGNGNHTPTWPLLFGRDHQDCGQSEKIRYLKSFGVESKIRSGDVASFDICLNIHLLSAPGSPMYHGLKEEDADYNPASKQLYQILRKFRNLVQHMGELKISDAQYYENLGELVPCLLRNGVGGQEIAEVLRLRIAPKRIFKEMRRQMSKSIWDRCRDSVTANPLAMLEVFIFIFVMFMFGTTSRD